MKIQCFLTSLSIEEPWPILKVLTERVLGPYKLITALHDTSKFGNPGGTMKMDRATTLDGAFVGDHKFATYLHQRGIVAELPKPNFPVCCVGFCKSENKWFGWSHRALCGFGIGDRLFKEREMPSDDTPFVRCGNTVIRTLDQAREAACNFAEYVG